MIGLLAAAANTVISPDGDHPPPHAWVPPDKQGLDDCLLKLCGSQLACGVAVTEVEEGSADAVEQNNVNPDAVHRSQLGEKQTEHIMSVDDALQVLSILSAQLQTQQETIKTSLPIYITAKVVKHSTVTKLGTIVE